MRQKLTDKNRVIKVREVEITAENGNRTSIDMMLDTRSIGSSILPSVARRLGYDTGSGLLGIIGGKSKHIMASSVCIKGKTRSTNVKLNIFDNEKLSEFGVEGFLGLDYIGDYRLVIDFKEGFIEITS
jgi:hypothetical protein